MDPGWVEHIEALLASGELSTAALALADTDGKPLLPQQDPLQRWSWRGISVAQASRWFRGVGEDVPRRVAAEFVPEETDHAGRRVVDALNALAATAPGALEQWVAAVQALVAETDFEPEVRIDAQGAWAQFVLPFDQRLPRLRWAGTGPIHVTVGTVASHATLHFSPDLVAHAPAGLRDGASAVIDVSDVLSLLGRGPGGVATMSNRSLHFLGMIGSRLPLERVIAPRDVPAGQDASRRMALAWLLAILGFSVTPEDLDGLRVLGGTHSVPMWHLIEAAREDPVAGLGDLRRRVDLDEILRRGLAADLDSDAALLVLASVLKWEIHDREDLRTAVVAEFEQHRGEIGLVHKIDFDAAIDRLLSTGHLVHQDERFTSCACMVTSALLRNIDDVLADLVGRIDAAIGVQEQAYEAVLALALHHAKDSLLSEEEIRKEAWTDVRRLFSAPR